MNEEEGEKPFAITSVCRQDLIEAGIPRSVVERLSDEDMQRVAARMEDLYVEYGSFWEDVKAALKVVEVQLVMRQAMQAFPPGAENEDEARETAFAAGVRYITEQTHIGEAHINRPELRRMAQQEWRLYSAPQDSQSVKEEETTHGNTE